jgi:hypothetical protein
LLTLARNARTSVQMIEEFYASNLTAEMNIGLLQRKPNPAGSAGIRYKFHILQFYAEATNPLQCGF